MDIFEKIPDLPSDIITYCRTTINTFKSYGVKKLDDLLKLVESYIFDSEITSTLLLSNQIFFGRNLNDLLYNI